MVALIWVSAVLTVLCSQLAAAEPFHDERYSTKIQSLRSDELDKRLHERYERIKAGEVPYEERYGVMLQRVEADELVNEPLKRLAFGSCQAIERDPKSIYDSILRYDPDLFLYTGDIVYAPNGCCEPYCLKQVYDELTSSSLYQEFERSLKRVEGIYDDHDLGINDGDGSFKYKDISQQYLMDFLKKPADHYRRKRKGAYFSILYRDPGNPKNSVKLIVLDARYHRSCYYYCPCQTCKWGAREFKDLIYYRFINSILGNGWDHDGDVLGEEQWRWLEGQLYNSEAESHIIVSSMQIFARYAITESWGLLPRAKDRLVHLMLETQPKRPVFVSGDVHYGEIDVMDGLVEVTSSSLTHSILDDGKNWYDRPFATWIYLTHKRAYMHNNFGGIDYEFDESKGALKFEVKLFSQDGELLQNFVNEATADTTAPYRDLDKKQVSFFKNTRIIKRRGILYKMGLVYLMICISSWMVLTPYIVYRLVRKTVEELRKPKLR